MNKLLRCFALLIGLLSLNHVWATDFIVTRTDGNVTDWSGPTAKVGLDGSFLKAVIDANAAGTGPHNIKFDASLAGQTIALNGQETSNLPVLTNSNVTIDGEALNITIERTVSWGNIFSITGSNNIVKNLGFSTNGASSFNFIVSGSTNILDNLKCNGIYFDIKGANNTLSKSTVNISNQQDAISAGGNATIITENTITYSSSSSQRYGVNIATGATNITISKNTISGFNSDIYSWSPGTNCQIIENNVSNSFNHNIFIQSGTNGILIQNNESHNAQYSGIVVQTCQNAIIKGNLSYANGQSTKGGAGIYDVGSTNTLIESNYIYSNLTNGIECEEGTKNLVIIKNVLGTDKTETTDLGNFGNDISIKDANTVTIGRPNEGNLIVYTKNKLGLTTVTDPLNQLDNLDVQHGMGIFISDLSGSKVFPSNVKIQGNFIGTDRTGTSTTMGTHLAGIYAEKQANFSTNSNLIIGGLNAGEANIIGVVTHPYRAAIQVWQVHNTLVQGNLIGTNGTNSIIPSNGVGIASNGCNNITIEQNTVTNTLAGGIYVKGGGALAGSNNAIVKNNIVVANSNVGILIQDQSTGNTVEGNTITTTNGTAIWISGKGASNNTIISNKIGDIDKLSALLENKGNGILVDNGATNNKIGLAAKGNIIKNKTTTFAAIQIDGSTTTGNTILANILSCNAGKGIELSNGGNQEYSSKTNPNWVTINTAEPKVDVISGKFQKVTTGNVRIDIYMTGDCQTRCSADAKGNITPNELAQGKTWVTSILVPANTGEWSYTLTQADKDAGLTVDNAIVTATDGSGNTSEFAVCEFDPPCTKPTSVTLNTNADAVCDGATITLTATASPVNPNNIIEWYKDGELLGDKGASLTISNKSQNGVYKAFIYDLDRNLCGTESATKTLTINDNPTDPTFTDANKELCAGTPSSTVSVTKVDGMTYQWTANNIIAGQGTNEITVDFSKATNPTVIKVKAINGVTKCESKEVTLNVTINANPTPVIEGDAAPLCNAQGVVYTVKNAVATSKYVWTIPNGATQENDKSGNNDTLTVNYADNNGNITVTETNEKGCIGKSTDFAISLKSCGLKADFSFDNAELCVESSLQKNTVTFTDKSTGDDILPDAYVWNFGEGATPATIGSQGPHTVKYATTGTKTIELKITDKFGTESTATYTVNVNDIPNANDFMIDGNGGCQNTTASFELKENNGSGVDLSKYNYDWSNTPDAITNGQGSTLVDVTLGSSKNGTVKVKIADKTTTCQIEKSKNYQITVQPNFNFIIDGNLTICDGASQHSKFNNDSTYLYQFMSGNDTISLSDIHPQTDSLFIYWKLVDVATKKVVDLTENGQQGFFSTDTLAGKNVNITLKPGFLADDYKNYTLSAIISKRGACADSTEIPISTDLRILKAHKYEFSIKDLDKKICEKDSAKFNAELKIDGKLANSTDHKDSWKYIYNWTPITSNNWWQYVNYWTYVDADPASKFAVSTKDTVFEVTQIIDKKIDTTYVIGLKNVGTKTIQNKFFLYNETNKIIVDTKDSLILRGDTANFCYTQPSVFADTLTDFTIRRPNGIIGLGTKKTGFPDTTQLTIKDVEEITLKDMNSLNNVDNTKWQWSWKNGEEFISDSIIDPAALSTVHYPRRLPEVIYRLVTSNGSCYDTTYAKLINLLLPFVPSSFSPNGDGKYDTWNIYNSHNYPDMVVKVFNRWGALVYESEKGYPVAWDGTRNNGDALPTATYFYVIEFNSEVVDNFINSEEANPYSTARTKEAAFKAGSITIIR